MTQSNLLMHDGMVAAPKSLRALTLFAFPAVCLDDSIIIAWLNHDEGLVTIDRYTSELQSRDYTYNRLSDTETRQRNWYYLQEFQSGELAFCTPDRIYIFY